MFSKSCEYAIRSVIIVCQNSKQGLKTNVKEISERAGVPEPYIAKVMQILVKAHLVQSSKGPGGGFFIDANNTELKLIDVVNAVDGDSLFTACGLGLKECSEKNPCPLHDKFKDIRNNLKKMLMTTSIHDLSEKLVAFTYTSK
ncbi:MAG: Rrf2 family transcriptional regulator [bacterium]|nr:Rrf2 family transcriptional regulator [bacterium]